MKKILIALLMLGLVSGCEQRERTYNIEKEGERYTMNEQLSFYYPRHFNVIQDGLKMSAEIYNEQGGEGLFIDTYYADAKNSPEERLSLYLTQLKNNGSEVKTNETVVLDSGKEAYLISGKSQLSGNYFIEVVLFEPNRQYVYSYIANQKIFEKQVPHMVFYLKTLKTNDLLS